jgi:hypothetical protein
VDLTPCPPPLLTSPPVPLSLAGEGEPRPRRLPQPAEGRTFS